ERGARRAPRRETVHLLAQALALSPRARADFIAAARARAPAHAVQGAPRVAVPSVAAPPVAVPAPSLRLIGRTREVTWLNDWLFGAGPPLLLFAGEPGIGKSCLLQVAAELAARHGWTILEGGCTRRGGQDPYAPLVGA